MKAIFWKTFPIIFPYLQLHISVFRYDTQRIQQSRNATGYFSIFQFPNHHHQFTTSNSFYPLTLEILIEPI